MEDAVAVAIKPGTVKTKIKKLQPDDPLMSWAFSNGKRFCNSYPMRL
jgi:hypothetical protein